jgi:hypothetical protein
VQHAAAPKPSSFVSMTSGTLGRAGTLKEAGHVLKELGGWSTFEMVLRYAHLAPDQLAQHASAVLLQEPARLVAVN